MSEGPERAEAIVVLGAKVLPGGVPSAALRARVEKAAELYRAGVAPLVLLSGGVGAHPPAEARVMRELAVALGVPQGACVLEEQSRSTSENAECCAPLLEARGLRQVIVVTDAFHLYRARQNFYRCGIDAQVVTASLEGRDQRWLTRARWTLRELAAIARRPWLLLQRRPPHS